jgi:hypothetical protein
MWGFGREFRHLGTRSRGWILGSFRAVRALLDVFAEKEEGGRCGKGVGGE